MKIEKNYSQVNLEDRKYKVKKKKMPRVIDVDLEQDFDSEWLYSSAYWGVFLNLWVSNSEFRYICLNF